MKKIIFYILLITSSFYIGIDVSFAEPRECSTGDYCSIKNKTLEEMDIYIENNSIVLKNIKKAVKASGGEKSPYYRKFVIGRMNQNITTNSFTELFDFFVSSIYEVIIPGPIYRDYQKIQIEGEKISKLMKMIESKGYNSRTIITKEEACLGVTGKCALFGKSSDILADVYRNNNNIKRVFRSAVQGREEKFRNYDDLFLVPNPNGDTTAGKEFSELIAKMYGANAVAECNQCSGGSFDDFAKSMKKFSQTLGKQGDAYDSWKDALNLAIGGTEDARQQKNERHLLQAELSRQGLQTNSAQIILQNYDAYHNPTNEDGRTKGFTWGNNFISNTFRSIVDDTTNDLDQFASTLDLSFNKTSQDPDIEMQAELLPLDQIEANRKKINTSIVIDSEIMNLYKLQLENIQKDDKFSTDLIGRIIDTHYNINEAIAILHEKKPIAEEVCDSQATGLGKCEGYQP